MVFNQMTNLNLKEITPVAANPIVIMEPIEASVTFFHSDVSERLVFIVYLFYIFKRRLKQIALVAHAC